MALTDSLFGEEGGAVLGDLPFQLLLFANVVGVFGTALVSPLLSTLIDPFGATPNSIGLLISLFSGPGIVFIPIAGYLADSVGRKHVIVAGLVTYGTAGGAIAFTTDFAVILILRVLQGIGYAGIVPVVITTLGDIYAGTEEAAAQGLRFTTSGLSLAVIPLLAGILVVFSWQYPFLLFFLAVPVALLVWVFLEEPATRLEDPPPNSASATSPNRITRFRRFIRMVTKPEIVSIIFARSLAAVALIGFFTYISIIVVSFAGGTPNQAGIAVGINSLAFATTASQVGRLSSRFFVPGLLIGGTTFIGAGISLVAVSNTLGPLLIGSTVLGMGIGIALTIYRSLVTSYAPENYRGSVVSVAELAGRFANFATPIGMGWVISVATPVVGFEPAVRWTGVGVGVLVTVGGFVCILIWYTYREQASHIVDTDV
jgi:MFS family permease